MEELGTSLIQLMEERFQNIERRKGKEVLPDETTRRVKPGVSNTAATKGGQAAAMERQSVERKKQQGEGAGRETTGEDTSGDSGKEREKSAGGRFGLSPNTRRTSAVTVTLNDRSGQYYEEVSTAGKNNVPLVEVGI